MREIEFRAWDKIDKRMEYDIQKRKYIPCISGPGMELHFDYYLNKLDYEIMQYTGLKDKNGKEIYEGDIISNPRYEETYMVEYYIDGYVGWGDDRRPGCYLITDEDIEVIGNIYENPELIK